MRHNGNKKRRIVNLTDESEKPVGQWNTMIVECVKNSIKVWVNGNMANCGFNCTATKGQLPCKLRDQKWNLEKLN